MYDDNETIRIRAEHYFASAARLRASCGQVKTQIARTMLLTLASGYEALAQSVLKRTATMDSQT